MYKSRQNSSLKVVRDILKEDANGMTISDELVATTAARQHVEHVSSNCCTTCWSRKTFQNCPNLIKPLHRELNLTTHDQTLCVQTVCGNLLPFPHLRSYTVVT
jgi:hypothetical protein